MSFEASLFVGFFIIVASIVVVVSWLNRGKRQAQEDELKRAASARGWTFSATTERGYRIYKFAGTTEGVPWEAESAKQVAGGNRRERRRHVGRWHGKWAPGLTAPMVAMGVPKGKEVMSFQVGQG